MVPTSRFPDEDERNKQSIQDSVWTRRLEIRRKPSDESSGLSETVALRVVGSGAGRIHFIRIDAGTHDGFKLLKSVPSFSPPGLVRSQVTRNNVWEHSRRSRNQNEVSTASQVRFRIHLCGFLTKVSVSAHGKFGGWARGVQ